MSIKVMSSVWDKSQQKGTALLLLLAIADHASEDGYCWPGTELLAKKIRMSVRSVLRMVKKLEADGELYVIRIHRNNRYIVRVGLEDDEVQAVLTAHNYPIDDKLSGDNLTRDNLSPQTCQVVTSQVTQLCHPNHHEPSSKRQEEPADGFPTSGSRGEKKTSPPEDKKESILNYTDPLQMASECVRRNGDKPSWTVPAEAGGANPFDAAPVDAFCQAFNIPRVTDKKRRSWGQLFKKQAESWGIGPEIIAQAIGAIPKDDDHKWRTFVEPRGDTWRGLLDVMIGKVQTGTTGTRIRISI